MLLVFFFLDAFSIFFYSANGIVYEELPRLPCMRVFIGIVAGKCRKSREKVSRLPYVMVFFGVVAEGISMIFLGWCCGCDDAFQCCGRDGAFLSGGGGTFVSSGYVAMLVEIRQRRERESGFGSAVSIVCVPLGPEMRGKETADARGTRVGRFGVPLFGEIRVRRHKRGSGWQDKSTGVW